MLALANELDEALSYEERRALCEEALAMAGGSATPCWSWTRARSRTSALWVARTAPERLELDHRGDGAGPGDRERAELRGVGVPADRGARRARPPAEMVADVALARREAERLRIGFGETVLDGMVVPWLAMAGAGSRRVRRSWSGCGCALVG